MYDLSDVLPAEQADSIPDGSSLLVGGPAMTGKEQFAYDVLAAGLEDGEGAIAVTTDDSVAKVLDTLEDRAPAAEPQQIAAIDCRGNGNQSVNRRADGAFVYHVSSPANLTDIGIGITQSFERFQESDIEQGRLGLTSLSTLLTYTNRETVFKFCHVLTSRLDAAEFLGVFTIDSSATEEQTLQIIKQSFDGYIQLRDTDGRQARLQGLESHASDWIDM